MIAIQRAHEWLQPFLLLSPPHAFGQLTGRRAVIGRAR
jgi:hypothetical protein